MIEKNFFIRTTDKNNFEKGIKKEKESIKWKENDIFSVFNELKG